MAPAGRRREHREAVLYPGEASRWQALADHEQPPAFFRGWTRKEVYFKARDVGLSAGLDRFEVSLAPPS